MTCRLMTPPGRASDPARIIGSFRLVRVRAKNLTIFLLAERKTVGQGDLRDQINKSLHFVLNFEFIEAITIGFESVEELYDVIKKISEV